MKHYYLSQTHLENQPFQLSPTQRHARNFNFTSCWLWLTCLTTVATSWEMHIPAAREAELVLRSCMSEMDSLNPATKQQSIICPLISSFLILHSQNQLTKSSISIVKYFAIHYLHYLLSFPFSYTRVQILIISFLYYCISLEFISPHLVFCHCHHC